MCARVCVQTYTGQKKVAAFTPCLSAVIQIYTNRKVSLFYLLSVTLEKSECEETKVTVCSALQYIKLSHCVGMRRHQLLLLQMTQTPVQQAAGIL